MHLESLLQQDLAVLIDGAASRDDVLQAIAAAAARAAGLDPDRVARALVEREASMPTATPEGVAFPHALLAEVQRTLLVPALCRRGVIFRPDRPPCEVVIGMIGPAARPFEHVQVLARLSRILHGHGALDRIRASGDARQLVDALIAEDRRHG